MSKVRLFVFFLTLVFVAGVGTIVGLLARGWRFDIKDLSFRPKGLFVATSTPDGAQVLIDGKLETATNATLSLPPETYDIEIKKEGFLPWKKRITVKKEEVTKIEAYLFPSAPSLSPITFSGAQKPLLSPDSTKLLYGVSASSDKEKVGIWLMELVDLPIGFSREPRKITDLEPENVTWHWSPDSREVLLETKEGYLLLGTGGFVTKNSLSKLDETGLADTLSKWQKEKDKKTKDMLGKLPKTLQEMIEKQTKAFVFSPDEKKLLYTASFDFNIPENLTSPLPGSSSQQQQRNVNTRKTYIYDIKEDRNFLVFDGEASLGGLIEIPEVQKQEKTFKMQKPKETQETGKTVSQVIFWFPTSNHIIVAQNAKITIMDYDGTNQQIVYAGPYEAPYALPFPNTSRLLILTNLGAGNGNFPNLYSISLR